MRSRRAVAAHDEAVSRRLALLTDELAASRGEPERPVGPRDAGDAGEWWAGYTRPAGRPALSVVPDPAPQPVSPPAPLPVPGRHAARRERVSRWPQFALPAGLGLPGRPFGAGHVAVVALLVAAALAVTTWQVVRDDAGPATVTVPPPQLGQPVSESGAPAPAATTVASTGTVTVDVAGRVRRPGIVVLDSGSRVADALEEAGGVRPGVDLTTLNLARVLTDGEQILVGLPGASVAPPPVPGAVTPSSPAPLVDLNTADQTLLETLPGIGPVTAAAIIAWRTEHGGFTAITELLEVDGIGDATLATLTPLVTI